MPDKESLKIITEKISRTKHIFARMAMTYFNVLDRERIEEYQNAIKECIKPDQKG